MVHLLRAAAAAFFLAACLAPAVGRAQALPVIPTAGFETWEPRTVQGPNGPINFQAPQRWDMGFASSLFTVFLGQAPRFDRSPIVHSGTGALRINVGADSIGGDLVTVFPAARTPLGLTAWVRNSRVLTDSSQTGFAIVFFTRSRAGRDADTVAIGGGNLYVPTANAWRQLAFPIFALQAVNPDSASVYIGNFGGLPNFQVWVDDLEFVNVFPTGALRPTPAAAPLTLSPNPAPRGGAAPLLTVPARAPGRAVLTVTDASGRTAGRVRLHELTAGNNYLPVPTTGLPAGVYMVRVIAAEGTRTTRLVME